MKTKIGARNVVSGCCLAMEAFCTSRTNGMDLLDHLEHPMNVGGFCEQACRRNIIAYVQHTWMLTDIRTS
jgi:hypothetical protein